MNTIFINTENSKTSDPFRLLINLPDEIDCTRSDKYVTLSNLSIKYTWENIKKSYKNNKFKISTSTWNEKLNYLTDRILYQVFKIFLSISSKTWSTD